MKITNCLRDGFEETKDLTPVESVIAVHGAKMVTVGTFGIIASKVAFGAVVAKGMVVMGGLMVGGAFTKGFVRGFREEWEHQKELKLTPEQRWRKANGLDVDLQPGVAEKVAERKAKEAV